MYMMRKLLTMLACAAAVAACEYDDSDLRQRVEDLAERVAKIEASVKTVNSQIESIGQCVDALCQGKVVMSVEQTAEGYELTMSDGSVITLTNGRDGDKGEPGEAGRTPVIGVRQDADGLYYWTVDGEWLAGADGEKVAAQGDKGGDGAAGHTPVIGAAKDDDGKYYWTVDGQWLTDADGNRIEASGRTSDEGAISSVVDKDDRVVVTLQNGTVLALPKLTDAAIAWVDQGDCESYYGDSRQLGITAENILSAVVAAPYGWTAEINLSAGKVYLTAPWVGLDVEYEGSVSVIAVTEGNIPVTISKRVRASYAAADGKKIDDLCRNVLPRYASAAEPFEAVFDVAEPQNSYCSISLAELDAAAVPSITLNFMQGGSGQVNIGSSKTTYSGTVNLNIGSGFSFTSGGNIDLRDATLVLGGDYAASLRPKCGYCFIGKESHVSLFELQYDSVKLINCGTIDELKVGVEAQALDYGKITTVTDTGDKLTLLPVRGLSASSSKYISQIIEFRPAPGQYGSVQNFYLQSSAEALVGSRRGGMISLGMFGGSLVFKFDHTVVNLPGIDFVISGNPIATAVEPGAVMVSYDANGNGLADDEWYELKGGLYDDPATVHGYSLTYTKDADNNCIGWTDNKGGSGRVGFNGVDKPATWWPRENEATEMTVTGTKLPLETMYEPNPGCEYGYVDVLTADYNTTVWGDEDTRSANKFDISWAVDSEGNPVQLLAVDFIKVYNPVFAIDSRMPMFGEISTEITGASSLTPVVMPAALSGIGGWDNGSSF